MTHDTTVPITAKRLACLLAAGLGLHAMTAPAHLPELFGREYVRAQATDGLGLVTAPPRRAALPEVGEEAAHLAALADREQADGPYGHTLTEPLVALGRLHRERGDLDAARAAYVRALHLVRVNDGLLSDRQLPVLKGLLELYRSAGDWPALDAGYRYYARVIGMGEPPHTPERLAADLEYLQWQREAFVARGDREARVHLLAAYLDNERLLDSMDLEATVSWGGYRAAVLSQLHNLYLIMGDDPVTASHGIMGTHAGGPNEKAIERIAHLQETGVARGVRLLRTGIDRAADAPVAELAELHLELGDWYQWNGKLRSASEEYARVEELLLEQGQEHLLERWLGQPQELPDEPGLWHPLPDAAAGGALVIARYNVSHRGDASNIEVSAAPGGDDHYAWRIRRMLRDTHFRPRFHQGRAQPARGIERGYRLVNP